MKRQCIELSSLRTTLYLSTSICYNLSFSALQLRPSVWARKSPVAVFDESHPHSNVRIAMTADVFFSYVPTELELNRAYDFVVVSINKRG